MRIKLLAAHFLSSIVAFGPNLGQAQDISALQMAVQSHACPGSIVSVGRLDATAQCDPGGKAAAACDQQTNAPSPAWQQCHIEILKCRQGVARKNEVIDNYNQLVEDCRRSGSGTKSSAAKSLKATAATPDKPPQKDQAARQRGAREAAKQAEAARQNAQMLEQQNAEQQAREAAGRICIADTGGYLIDSFTKKSPVWAVCQDLCTHTPTDGLPLPINGTQNEAKRDRYCERQCQLPEVSEARCYQIKPDQRANVLHSLRLDWDVHEESQFLPGN